MTAYRGMRPNRVADIEGEMIGYMPERFVMMYYEMVEGALRLPGSSMDREKLLAGEAGRGKHGRQEGGSSGGLKDVQALEDKRKIDMRLRMLVREFVEGKSSGNQRRDRCPDCGAFTSGKYCAGCGIELGTMRRVSERVRTRAIRFEDFVRFMQFIEPAMLNRYLKMIQEGNVESVLARGEELEDGKAGPGAEGHAGVVKALNSQDGEVSARQRRKRKVWQLEEGEILRIKLRLEQIEMGVGESGIQAPKLR